VRESFLVPPNRRNLRRVEACHLSRLRDGDPEFGLKDIARDIVFELSSVSDPLLERDSIDSQATTPNPPMFKSARALSNLSLPGSLTQLRASLLVPPNRRNTRVAEVCPYSQIKGAGQKFDPKGRALPALTDLLTCRTARFLDAVHCRDESQLTGFRLPAETNFRRTACCGSPMTSATPLLRGLALSE
jgi:hypothetical protein